MSIILVYHQVPRRFTMAYLSAAPNFGCPTSALSSDMDWHRP
ncbi:hypothetical protein RSAG8_07822, partial [Rhizoctonia solani AG-8 WAC10335]